MYIKLNFEKMWFSTGISKGKCAASVYPCTLKVSTNDYTPYECSNNWKLWNTFRASRPTILKPRTNRTNAGYVETEDDSRTVG